MVRSLFALGLFTLFSNVYAHDFRVTKQEPYFSVTATFTCHHGDEVDATGVRRWWGCPRYHYELFDLDGRMVAEGITRFFSLGLIASWATDIDIYSGNEQIGFIEGKVFTQARAKFVFYDPWGREIANAFLEEEDSSFIIVSPSHEKIAKLSGQYFGDLSSWEVTVYQNVIDERVLRIFALFAADYHKYFLPRPKEVNHYYFIPYSSQE